MPSYYKTSLVKRKQDTKSSLFLYITANKLLKAVYIHTYIDFINTLI